MSFKHKELIQHCIELLNTFQPTKRALEDHVNYYMNDRIGVDENDQTFIVEVFSGCVRYGNILNVVMTGYFNRDGKSVLRSEENIYRVLSYLALFRLDELGLVHFRKFVKTQDVNKMYRFLNFFLDDKNMRTWMKDEWNKMYDTSFVQTTLLSPVLRWLPELQELIKELKTKIDNKSKTKKQKVPSTEVQPFNITQPRPRSIPIPEEIPKLVKHKPAPKSLYEEPKEKNVMAEIREANRRRAEERLMEASKLQLNCARTEKSQKTIDKMNNILAQQDSQLDFERHTSNPVPQSILSENIPIKLNTAAILREGKLYRQREQKELERIEKLEAGAKDGSEFKAWQNKMKQKDLDEQLADIERRRLQGKLSHEEAILARQNLIKENQKKVEEMKEEARILMQQYLERRMQEEEDMKQLVEQVLDTHENAKEAKKKLQEYKAKIVKEVNDESKELMRQALEEAEIEMKQKIELIQQIRAAEAVPVIRFKLVDFAKTAGHGLLSEMSIAELRERLSLTEAARQAEEESLRDNILTTKQNKTTMLMDTLQTISRHRTEQSKAAAIRLEQRKKTHQERPVYRDEKLLELERKLEEKRQQRKQEQKSAKIVPNKQSANRIRELNASKPGPKGVKLKKKMMEENRWRELERTREHTAKLTSKGIVGSQSASRIAGRPMVAT